MAQTIKLKRSSTSGAAPTTSQLELGEVAINTYDGKMYIKKDVGGTESIVEITAGSGGSSNLSGLSDVTISSLQTDQILKYNGSAWVNADNTATTTASAILVEYQFTATASQTTFSGSDDNSETLSYTANAVQVFLNGILLDSATDYTATNGTSVVLTNAAALDDYVQVVAFKKKIGDGNVSVDTFTGDDSTTAFTLSLDPGDENNTRVFIDGVYQSKSNYSVSGTTLTFSTAPPTSTAVEVEIGNRVVTLDTLSDLDLPDDVKLRLGTGQDLQIYHDGTNSVINQTGTGDLLLQKDETTVAEFNVDGVTVTGDVEASEFVGDLNGATLFHAKAGENLSKGDVVYISGISGNKTIVSKADADDSAKMPAFGVVKEDSNNNSDTIVYTFGRLFNLDTSTFNEGDELFVSTTAGAFTSTAPTGESAALQKIGKVTRSHASSGSIFVMGAGRSNAVPNLDDGDIFIGNASNQAGTESLTSAAQTAGALMDSEVTNLAQVKAFDSSDYATAAQGTTADSALQNVVEDTTPQLGGDLASNGNDILFADNDKAIFGAGSDLQIYHDGSHSYVSDQGTGRLVLNSSGAGVRIEKSPTENMAIFTPDGNCELFYDNSLKLATTSAGIDVTGTVTADGLTVDGIAEISSTTPTLRFFETDQTDEGTLLRSAGDSFQIAKMLDTGAADGIRFAIDQSSGDISFYEDTGTTAKLEWLASDEDLKFADNSKAIFGAGSDLTIFSDGGTFSYINNTQGVLRIRNTSDDQDVVIQSDNGSGGVTDYFAADGSTGAAKLYNYGSQKLATTSTGIDVTGTVTADGLTVNSGSENLVATFQSTDTEAQIALVDTTGTSTIRARNDFRFHVNNAATPALKIDSNNDISFYEDTGTTAKLFWDSSAESLGIGTISPNYLLDVEGSGVLFRINATSGDATAQLSVANTTSLNTINFGDSGSTTSGQILYRHNGDSMAFNTAGSEAMRIDSSGNVGIGMTPVGSVLLDLKEPGSGSDLLIGLSAGTGARAQLRSIAQSDGTSSAVSIHTTSGGATGERMRIDSSGNLLVGKTNTNFNTAGSGVLSTGEGQFVRDGGHPISANRKTSDGDLIYLAKDGVKVGSIGARGGDVYLETGDTGIRMYDQSNAIIPVGSIGISRDAAIDLGISNIRFKDLHLSGTVNAATLNIDGGTIKLDGNSPMGGTNNVALGNQAGQSMTTATTNVLIGSLAGDSLTTGSSNVAIGYSALASDDVGQWNVAIGRDALQQQNIVTAANTYNTAVGGNAMKSNTTGTSNTAVGGLALDANTTASNNTSIGYQSLTTNTTGASNTAIGHSALSSNSTGEANTAVGRQALLANTASSNTAIGYQAGYSVTSGTPNTFVGVGAGFNSTGGANVVALGYKAAYSNANTNFNVAIGNYALEDQNEGGRNVAVGYQALKDDTKGARNVAVGWNTLGKQNFTSVTTAYNTAIGYNTMSVNTTGQNNTALGALALDANTTASNNTAIGMEALTVSTTGGSNTAVGYASLLLNTTGSSNTAIGREALRSNTTASNNTSLGYRSLYANTTGTSNTAVGKSALSSVSTGGSNVAVGARALENNTTGGSNIAMGFQALRDSSTAGSNIAIGQNALVYNSSGGNNVAVGQNALFNTTTGNTNVAIGNNAMLTNTTGVDNTSVGYYALNLATTSSSNAAFGSYALRYNTTGTKNVAVGAYALDANTTSNEITAIGYAALSAHTTGLRNTAVGFEAGLRITTGTDNVIVGGDAAPFITTGSSNTVMGREALRASSTGSSNTAIGTSALRYSTGGGNNTAVGSYAGYLTTTGGQVTYIGRQAGYANTTGIYNVALGSNALFAATTANRNTAVGTFALQDATTGGNNTAVGYDSLRGNTTGIYNTVLGYQAFDASSTGNYNTAIGANALGAATGSGNTFNTAVGFSAGENTTTGYYNTFLGTYAGNDTSTGRDNTFVGYQAALENTTGYDNVSLGSLALRENTTGARSVALGAGALKNNTSGNYGVAIGFEALKQDGSIEESVAVGAFALQSQTSGRNTALGYAAGLDMTTGSYNTLLGGEAGENLTTGSNNTAIGLHALRFATTTSNNTALGYQAAYNTTNNDNIAIGRESLYSNQTGTQNVAIGSLALYANTSSYNTAIGFNSQRSNTSGNLNTSIGIQSLYNNTTGVRNIAMGYLALNANTTTSDLVAIGTYALQSNTSGNYNTALGRSTLATNTTASRNTAVGFAAMNATVDGGDNTGVGAYSLYNNTSGYYNTGLGKGSLQSNTTGSRNTALGYNAADAISTGINNTAIGADTLSTIQTGNHNIAIGRAAMQGTATGISGNVAIGIDTLETAQGSYNTGVGYRALQASNTSNNVGIGHEAGLKVTSGKVTAVGSRALHENTTGTGNVALGEDVAYYNTTGSYNVAMGNAACQANTTGSRNVHIGQQAGEYNTGTLVTAIGNQAAQGLSNNTNAGSYSVFVGAYAGLEINTGQVNCFVGYAAGQQVTTGGKNTIVGSYQGNGNGLDIRTSNNYIVLSDGDGNPRGIFNSSGDFIVGGAAIGDSDSFGAYATGNIIISRASGSSRTMAQFENGNAVVGSITTTTSATAYNTSSDHRLKENVVAMTGATARLKQLAPKRFNFIADADTTVDGFLAHEVQTVVPEAITGTHNEVDDDGNPVYQGIDQSKLVPLLVATIKELEARITALESQ